MSDRNEEQSPLGLDTIECEQRLQSDSCLLNESPPMVEGDGINKEHAASYKGLNPVAAYMEDSSAQ